MIGAGLGFLFNKLGRLESFLNMTGGGSLNRDFFEGLDSMMCSWMTDFSFLMPGKHVVSNFCFCSGCVSPGLE